jgi:hypothetical protein
MYVYSWLPSSNLEILPNDIKSDFKCRTNDDGIESLNDKNDVIISFNDCINLASKNIPNNRKHRTFIALLLITSSLTSNDTWPNDGSISNTTIIADISQYLNQTEFIFINEINVINSNETDILQWISINYKLNRISKSTKETQKTTTAILQLKNETTNIIGQMSADSSSLSSSIIINNITLSSFEYSIYLNQFKCSLKESVSIYQLYILKVKHY